MLPCPQRPWAFPRWEMTCGIWVLSAPQVAKLVKFKDSLIYSCDLLLQAAAQITFKQFISAAQDAT